MKNSDLPEDILAWVRTFIDNRFWKYAKTYAKTAPHSYTVREWQPDKDDEFVDMLNIITDYGTKEKFYRTTFTYLYVDGQKYWATHNAERVFIIINRCDWGNFYGSSQ